MGVHRRDKTDRLTAVAPPRVKVTLGRDGEIDITSDQDPSGVHPETVAEERPPLGDDPRPAMWSDIGGQYAV